jgi:hypothetical protein
VIPGSHRWSDEDVDFFRHHGPRER